MAAIISWRLTSLSCMSWRWRTPHSSTAWSGTIGAGAALSLSVGSNSLRQTTAWRIWGRLLDLQNWALCTESKAFR